MALHNEIFEAIKNSQDNNCLNLRDEYGRFLIGLLDASSDGVEVNAEEMADNLRYAIDQFSKALKTIEDFQNT